MEYSTVLLRSDMFKWKLTPFQLSHIVNCNVIIVKRDVYNCAKNEVLVSY